MASNQQAFIQRALDILKASGCEFKIITPEGREFVKLKVIPKRKRINDFRSLGYQNKIRQMNVGDVLVMAPPAPEAIGSLRSTLMTMGARLYGKGSITSMVVNGEVQIMRVA